MTVVLSGIQSSGRLHFGNYFGAIRQHIALQQEPGEHLYFIADYHALTSSRDPAELRDNVREVALTYLALGLDPARATLFRQSDVPEVCELAWLLACVAPNTQEIMARFRPALDFRFAPRGWWQWRPTAVWGFAMSGLLLAGLWGLGSVASEFLYFQF